MDSEDFFIGCAGGIFILGLMKIGEIILWLFSHIQITIK